MKLTAPVPAVFDNGPKSTATWSSSAATGAADLRAASGERQAAGATDQRPHRAR
ncbi:MAG: hypothetical protein U0802_25505 [Candidatus Binatia bacterium]